MRAKPKTRCSKCRRSQEQLDAQKARIETLEAIVLELQEQLAAARKDSSTSSKPPSSDIVKPPAAASAASTKRARGGQPGHPRHQRTPFPPEVVQSIDHPPGLCPDCGHGLQPIDGTPRVLQ